MLLALTLAACSGDDGQRLTITGSSTVAPLVNEIARRYEQEHPGSRIDVQTGGSTRGINDARSGLADIGMASRALGEEEHDLAGHPIARDGIALIVHADNPVQTLDDDSVRAIFRGEVRNWSALGGPDRAITVVNKADGRSTLELFLAYYGLRSSEVRADLVIGDNEQGLRTVASDPSAIGYVSVGAAEFAVARGDRLRALPMNGVAPDSAALRRGRFPLSRPLTLVTRGAPSGLAADFIAYARSDQVHDLIEGMYFVPLDDRQP